MRKITFGIGIVGERDDRNLAYFSVQSARAIANVIIPHFDKYPLIDYLLFRQAVYLLLDGQARFKGISQIISIKGSMNKGLSDVLKIHFRPTSSSTSKWTRHTGSN